MTDPVVNVSGDPERGFIVEVHDGDRHERYGLMESGEEEARAEGLRRFHAPAPVVA